MIDPTLQIRTHYIDRLAGISCPVFNMPQQTDKPPFVVVTTRSNQESLTKCEMYIHRVTTTFDIIVTSDGDWGGDKMAEDISNEIMPLVMPLGSTTDFRIVSANVEGNDPLPELYTTGRVIRKVITLNNLVSQT
jgi:hypothetical protein